MPAPVFFRLVATTPPRPLLAQVDLTHYDGLVGYKGSSFTAALQSTAKLSKLHASYFQDVSADVKVRG